MASAEHLTHDDLRDIQGNLAGFNKDHQRFLFINLPDQASGRNFLAAMAQEINHAEEVREFNAEFKRRMLAGEDELSVAADWVNLGISFAGLSVLGASGLSAFSQEFQAGMRERGSANGDVDGSDPANWIAPFAPGAAPVHLLVIIAADLPDLLDDRTAVIRTKIAEAGVVELAFQDGNTRPEPFRGQEHFGFKDGISQPNVPYLTSGNKGGPEIAVGEFVVGYEDQDGNISGSAVPQPAQPTEPGQPGYPDPTPPAPQPLPSWARNGSFLIYRRLRQDVAGFRNFVTQIAPTLSLSEDQLGAKIVGRWKSGAPLEHVPGEPAHLDPTAEDPASTVGETVLADNHINNFGYLEQDADGHLTPHAAHIRKMWPRDEEPPGSEEANRHRIIRRGIVYGPEFQEAEPPYPGSGPVPDDQDRGLLFVCYQSAIERGFEFIQQSWANITDFPQTGDGVDPIISQNDPNPAFPLPANPHLTTQRWVTTTGGEYFFAPSVSTIASLGAGAA